MRTDPEAFAAARELGPAWADAAVAVVLGSGLGGAAACLEIRAERGFRQVPGLGACGVPGHSGRLLRGTVGGTEAVVFQGRRHFYEGLPAAAVAFPARLAAALGASALVMCSAVGAVDAGLGVGSWVFVEDHVNFMGRNPLEGVRNEDGPAFVDLTSTYRNDLYESLRDRLGGRGLNVSRGVLAAFPGPTYETPAEVRMARTLGAAIVGMSTVPEAVWARYLGLDVVAWGRVVNLGAGLASGPIAHDEVLRQSELGAEEAVAVVKESVAAWRGAVTGDRH